MPDLPLRDLIAASTTKGSTRFVLWAAAIAVLPSLLVFAVLVALGIDTLRPPRAALDPAFVLYSTLVAPAIETAVMLALAALLLRLLPRRDGARMVLITIIAALAHRIGGSWLQVAVTVWPLFVYSASIVLWMKRSARSAFIVTTIVHMLYNAAFFAVGVLAPLAMRDG